MKLEVLAMRSSDAKLHRDRGEEKTLLRKQASFYMGNCGGNHYALIRWDGAKYSRQP